MLPFSDEIASLGLLDVATNSRGLIGFLKIRMNLMLIIREYDRAEPELAVLIFPRNMHFNGLKTYFLIWPPN